MHVNISIASRYVMNLIRSLDLRLFLIHVAPCSSAAVLLFSNDTNSMRNRSLQHGNKQVYLGCVVFSPCKTDPLIVSHP